MHSIAFDQVFVSFVRFLTWTFYQYFTERIMIYNRLYTGEHIKIRIVLQNLAITNSPCKIYNTRDNLP